MNSIKEIAIRLFGEAEPCRCNGGHEICLHCNVCRAQAPDQLYDPAHGLAGIIDATILKANATQADIQDLCQTAVQYQTASVCVNSHFIPLAKSLMPSGPATCTVINFPLGAGYPEAVASEARSCADLGLQEIDMVQNLSAILSGDTDAAYETINLTWLACHKKGILLKVILENCYLTKEQIVVSCLLAKKAGADFVKSSTGFGTGGATVEDIALMRQVVGPKLGVKASGGVRDKAQAVAMVEAGANRIGASNAKAIVD